MTERAAAPNLTSDLDYWEIALKTGEKVEAEPTSLYQALIGDEPLLPWQISG